MAGAKVSDRPNRTGSSKSINESAAPPQGSSGSRFAGPAGASARQMPARNLPESFYSIQIFLNGATTKGTSVVPQSGGDLCCRQNGPPRLKPEPTGSRDAFVVVDVRVARGRAGRRRGDGRSVAMTEHAVVIAGGGPTGLMLAGELALVGIDVAIVERRASQDLAGARAGGLHSRTIEVLDPAWDRRSLPFARAGRSGRGLLVHPSRHQRLPHPPQLRARAPAEPHRAHHGRLGRRAAGGGSLHGNRSVGVRRLQSTSSGLTRPHPYR